MWPVQTNKHNWSTINLKFDNSENLQTNKTKQNVKSIQTKQSNGKNIKSFSNKLYYEKNRIDQTIQAKYTN